MIISRIVIFFTVDIQMFELRILDKVDGKQSGKSGGDHFRGVYFPSISTFNELSTIARFMRSLEVETWPLIRTSRNCLMDG